MSAPINRYHRHFPPDRRRRPNMRRGFLGKASGICQENPIPRGLLLIPWTLAVGNTGGSIGDISKIVPGSHCDRPWHQLQDRIPDPQTCDTAASRTQMQPKIKENSFTSTSELRRCWWPYPQDLTAALQMS